MSSCGNMAVHLDKELKHLSIEEEDEPFVLPDRPEFYATERNSLSIIGRLLNPQCQRMADLILRCLGSGSFITE